MYSVRYMIYTYFLLVCGLFHFPNRVFQRANALNFDEVQLINFYSVMSNKDWCNPMSQKFSPVYSSRSFQMLCFTFYTCSTFSILYMI